MTKPDICIYHHPCSDGFTAAWAVWKRWPDIEFVPGAYKAGELPDVAGKHVLIVDFSYKGDVMRQLAETAASITVLDHHESAERELKPLLEEGVIDGEFDMTRSGAMMAWQHVWPEGLPDLCEDRVPWLVRYVQDRDLWQWEIDHSREISAYIQTKSLTFSEWDKLADELEDCDCFDLAKSIGEVLVAREESEVKGAIKATKRRAQIAGYDVPVANLPYQMASLGGNFMCKGEPFSASYFLSADGTISFSLRSDKDDPEAVNVSLIAGMFGGGGHKNASGFRMDAREFSDWMFRQ
jgi:oligoribonuclease NrnB/cAMP/cGMP phosphodiesterase (DHH superfamily)